MPLTKAKTDILDLNKDLLVSGGIKFGRGSGGLINNLAIGVGALNSQSSASTLSNNTAVGYETLFSNTTGKSNTALGHSALYNNQIGEDCVAIGYQTNGTQSNGIQNTSVGNFALLVSDLSAANTAIGFQSLVAMTEAEYNTAIGAFSLSQLVSFTNCSGLGHSAQVTGSNQVQLGDSGTTTYAYGTVQNRSDERDKTDIRDTELGLDFVKALRPVDFKWDMREDYRPEAPSTVIKPADLKDDATEEEKSKYDQDLAAYNAYLVEKAKWLEDVKLANITHNGSKKRNRYHHGLIAQEVKAVLDEKGIDFGGFQDHKIAGGDDVLSIGYNELIAPMIKAIQELSTEVASLKAQLNP